MRRFDVVAKHVDRRDLRPMPVFEHQDLRRIDLVNTIYGVLIDQVKTKGKRVNGFRLIFMIALMVFGSCAQAEYKPKMTYLKYHTQINIHKDGSA